MSFTYENQGNNTYLVYKIGASDNVDTMSLGMITNNKIDGIVPTLFTQSDTDRFIKYNISAKVSAKEFLSGVVNKKRLLGVFISVLKAIKSTEEYMIDARSLLIDLEHIYVDVSKCDAMLVCLPLVRQNESVNIPMFFKQIMFSTQFDQNENCDYVAQIINYLNSTPVFSVDAFEKLLMDIDADNLNIAASKAGQQKPVQPQSQSQSQQPKPMQPAMNQLKNAQVQTNMPSQGKMQSQRETQSANNVVQPNQVNFAVPNMNPQNQNRINNNVQMGTNISGTYVETTSEKQMSMFGLLTHYSKENKQIYERQKAQRKAQKEAEKNGAAMPGQNVKASNASFAIPGQPPQQRPQPQTVMPQQPQQQFAQPQRQFTQSNQPQSQFAQPQPMPQAQQKPVQQVQPQPVQNQNTNTGMTGNPSVPPQILENMTKAGNFGETTVLGVGSEAGETTVLGTSQAQIIKPYLLRIKNNERIELNKPVFRIGKERSYVDYFVSDNTAVSRSHANIINKDNEFYIVDTNSTNHTYVNGSMIQSNVETKIEHGTKIRLANEDFEFFMY